MRVKKIRILSPRMRGHLRRLLMSAVAMILFFGSLELLTQWLVSFDPSSLEGPKIINSHGYRDYEHSRQQYDNVTRIVCIGDSVTFGHGVLFKDTYPFLLQKTLNSDSATRYEVITIAKRGWSWKEKLAAFQEVQEYEPDILIYQYDPNDVDWDIEKMSFFDHFLYILYYSKVVRTLQIAMLDHMPLESKPVFLRAIIEKHQSTSSQWRKAQGAHKKIADQCRECRIFPIFLADFNIRLGNKPHMCERMDFVCSEVEHVGFHVLPVYKLVERKPARDFRVAFMDFHPNKRLHRIYATMLAQMIRSKNYPDSRQPFGEN